MYITELITALQLCKTQYGDIQVTIEGQRSFQLTLELQDLLDPKTLEPIEKIVVLT